MVEGGLRKHWKKILLVSLLVIAVVTIVVLAIAIMDVAGHSATGSQTLNPTGTPVGKALVIYNPGLSGQAKEAAMVIGNQLVAEGYVVTVAGVKSSAANDLTDCDIVIVGGPMYGGKSSSSVEEYLKALTPTEQLKLGVYTTTGNANFDQGSFNTLSDQVVSLVGSKPLIVETEVRLILTVGVEDDSKDMVQDLLT
jgi:flavodoxin